MLNAALPDGAWVIISEYVLVVVPSWPVTAMSIVVLIPSVKSKGPDDAVPDVTAAPSTVIVALGSADVGVIVIDAVALAVVEVSIIVPPLVPALRSLEAGVRAMALNKALADGARVTMIT